jgi:hypothetical protein
MQASRIRQGVTKSGSPTPKETTSCICDTMSKNRLIPEAGADFTM